MKPSILLSATQGIETQTFCFLEMQTEPKMNKGKGENANPYIGRVLKITRGNVLICSQYQNRVNNNLKKEGKDANFVAQKSNVGEHVTNCVLFNEEKGTYYLEFEWFKEIPRKVSYLLNGKTVWNETEFKQYCGAWIPEVKPYGNQGLDRTVNILTVKSENIKEFTVKQTNFRCK